MQAALTGHLVLSTLHTNDSAGAVTRLIDMGVESYKLAAALVGVVAQRLVRTICPHCKHDVLSAERRAANRSTTRATSAGRSCAAKAAAKCYDTGFQGPHRHLRSAQFEPRAARDYCSRRPTST